MTAVGQIDQECRWPPRRLPTLETRHLTIRAPQPADADAIAAGLADYEVARMLTRVPSPFFRQDALDWLGGLPNGIGSQGCAFAVTLDEAPVGCIGFDWRPRGIELGYWLGRPYWRRGLMSEAVSAALGWYFAEVPGGIVHSGALSDNAASLKLQQKLGFAVVGLSNAFSLARNRSHQLIETRLDRAAFMPAAAATPAIRRHAV